LLKLITALTNCSDCSQLQLKVLLKSHQRYVRCDVPVLMITFLRERTTRHECIVNYATKRRWQSHEKNVAKKHEVTGLTQETAQTKVKHTRRI